MLIAEMATLQTLASLIIAFTVVRAVSLTDKSEGQNYEIGCDKPTPHCKYQSGFHCSNDPHMKSTSIV